MEEELTHILLLIQPNMKIHPYGNEMLCVSAYMIC